MAFDPSRFNGHMAATASEEPRKLQKISPCFSQVLQREGGGKRKRTALASNRRCPWLQSGRCRPGGPFRLAAADSGDHVPNSETQSIPAADSNQAASQAERVERPRVAALDEILGVPLKVLDDGFIRVVDYMGSDASIVQAARVSYGAGTKHVQEDRGLIRYLMRHWHTTPFEMCEIKMHVRVPMDCWRQWIRHRTGSVNEYSTRYSIAIDAAQRTTEDQWRAQAATNRQGSGDLLPTSVGAQLTAREQELQSLSRTVYDERLEAGVAREQARKDLPLATYTEAYWKTNLHNLLHFLRLRMDAHAQLEIRDYACTIGEQIVARWVPAAWEAFTDYRMESTGLSRLENEVLGQLTRGNGDGAVAAANSFGWLNRRDDGTLKANRERIEFEAKAEGLGLTVPWQN
jgi:thymidylate synthase (FAD)